MWIFANGTKSMEMAGALAEDQLPEMTMMIEDDEADDVDDSNNKVGRNDDDDNATTAMDIPAGESLQKMVQQL